jgi:hypothetical protein
MKLSLDKYNVIIIVVLLHELMHWYTKICLDEHITPKDIDLDDGEVGKSGWELEDQVFHGRLVVEWGPGGVMREMDSIARIILKGRKSVGVIGKQANPLFHISHLTLSVDEATATAIIMSLESDTLHTPAIRDLMQCAHECPPGYFRARDRVKEVAEKEIHSLKKVGTGLGIEMSDGENLSGSWFSYTGMDRY